MSCIMAKKGDNFVGLGLDIREPIVGKATSRQKHLAIEREGTICTRDLDTDKEENQLGTCKEELKDIA